jgi:hypothetical protein
MSCNSRNKFQSISTWDGCYKNAGSIGTCGCRASLRYVTDLTGDIECTDILLAQLVLADDDGDESGAFQVFESAPERAVLAHGVLMTMVFTFFLPLGAILLRVIHSQHTAWIHGLWQMFFYTVALAAFGVGAWMATIQGQWTTSNGHPIIGTIVIGLLLFQPIGGIIHHRLYKQRNSSTAVGTGHKWAGRVLLLLGVINGGLGLQLAGEGNEFIIAYGVIAGVLYLAWFIVSIWHWKKSSGTEK